MTDILNSAKQHDWYAHDETLAEELIDEIERLRADLLTRDGQAQELQGECARLREALKAIEYWVGRRPAQPVPMDEDEAEWERETYKAAIEKLKAVLGE